MTRRHGMIVAVLRNTYCCSAVGALLPHCYGPIARKCPSTREQKPLSICENIYPQTVAQGSCKPPPRRGTPAPPPAHWAAGACRAPPGPAQTTLAARPGRNGQAPTAAMGNILQTRPRPGLNLHTSRRGTRIGRKPPVPRECKDCRDTKPASCGLFTGRMALTNRAGSGDGSAKTPTP